MELLKGYCYFLLFAKICNNFEKNSCLVRTMGNGQLKKNGWLENNIDVCMFATDSQRWCRLKYAGRPLRLTWFHYSMLSDIHLGRCVTSLTFIHLGTNIRTIEHCLVDFVD